MQPIQQVRSPFSRTFNVTVAIAVFGALIPREAAAEDVIYACYVPSSGTIYRIKATDPTETCKAPSHVEFHWNVQGPAGADGTNGADGADGVDGVSGWETVQATEDFPLAGTAITFAACPTGKKVLGGGHSVVPASLGNPTEVFLSAPSTTEFSSGWLVHAFKAENPDPASGLIATLKAYAVCASVTTTP